LGRKSKSGIQFHATLIKDMALFMTKMATKTYEGVGTLTYDTNNRVVVGPMLPVQMGDLYPAKLKVYATSAECYTARIDHLLRNIREKRRGWHPLYHPRDPVWLYLSLLEAKELVAGCEDINRPEPTYLRHSDDHAAQYLTDSNGHIKAILDWDL
jgi:hypothetical protein